MKRDPVMMPAIVHLEAVMRRNGKTNMAAVTLEKFQAARDEAFRLRRARIRRQLAWGVYIGLFIGATAYPWF